MNAKSKVSQKPWADPDDAPELTQAFFEKAQPSIGGKPVSRNEAKAAFAHALRRGRPPVAVRRPTLNMRVDADVLNHLRALGKGWQTKVNQLLREAVSRGKI